MGSRRHERYHITALNCDEVEHLVDNKSSQIEGGTELHYVLKATVMLLDGIFSGLNSFT